MINCRTREIRTRFARTAESLARYALQCDLLLGGVKVGPWDDDIQATLLGI
jgi:hypothetical protein